MRIFYIEGPDLSGKTTLINELRNIFNKLGLNCITLKEPSGLTRELILNSQEYLCPIAERLYFLSNHINVLSHADKLASTPRNIILIDRSAIVSDYIQMKSTNYDDCIDYIEKVRPVITDTDITKTEKGLILLTTNEKTIRARANKRARATDKNDGKGLGFKLKVAEEYSKISENKDLISYFDSFGKFDSEDENLVDRVGAHILKHLELESLNADILDFVLRPGAEKHYD